MGRRMNKKMFGFLRVGLVLLLVLLWSLPVCAADAKSGENGTAEAAMLTEEPENEYFGGPETDETLSSTLYIVGGVLVFAGAGGFVCMFVWRSANRRRDQSEEVKEVILDEIKKSEEMGRMQQTRKPEPVAGRDLPVSGNSEYAVPELPPMPKEIPIVPSTPVSMQPAEVVRPRVQPVPVPVQASAAVPKQEPKPEPKPEPQTAAEPQKPKYDLDEILREIREGRL